LPGLSCLLHLRRKTALGKGRERCFVRFVIFRSSAVLTAGRVGSDASGVVFTFDVVRQGRMDEWSEALGGCAADQTVGHNYTSIAGVYNHDRGQGVGTHGFETLF
jgi:hypothetical protein